MTWVVFAVQSCMFKYTSQGIESGPMWKFFRFVTMTAAWSPRVESAWNVLSGGDLSRAFIGIFLSTAKKGCPEQVWPCHCRLLNRQNPAPALEQSFWSLLIVDWSATDLLRTATSTSDWQKRTEENDQNYFEPSWHQISLSIILSTPLEHPLIFFTDVSDLPVLLKGELHLWIHFMNLLQRLLKHFQTNQETAKQ